MSSAQNEQLPIGDGERMIKVRIPQLYALHLEIMLAHGLTPFKIVELLRANDAAEITAIVDTVKWDRLLAYAQDNWETIESAVWNGYDFTFMTFDGVVSLLAIKFQKHNGEDYRSGGEQIEGLHITSAEYTVLREMIPSYWNFSDVDSSSSPSPDMREIDIKFQNAAQ